MDSLNISVSNVIKIKANDYGDVIAIDMSDSNMVGKFSKLVQNMDIIYDRYAELEKQINEKYKNRTLTNEDDVDIEQIIERADFRIKVINDVIDEINNVFGKDTLRKVFRDSYELNEDFIPDEDAINDFLDQMIPIMTKLFNERFDRNKKKYNPNRRGKHNRTKEELLAELKEKSGASE